MVFVARSIARMRFSRGLIITALPERSRMPAPHRLVLPPCGTIGTPAAAQTRTTPATSSVDAGRTTRHRAAPW